MRNLALFFFVWSAHGCIERLEVEGLEQRTGALVVTGQITDAPGPYEVKLFRTTTNTDNLSSITYLMAKRVTIFDDIGESEVLTQNEQGIYETRAGGIRGKVGRKYAVSVEMLDGSVFESKPDELISAGEIDEVRTVWESQTPLSGTPINGFRVFLNSTAAGPGSYLRWRFSGVYMLEAFPELRRLNDANCAMDPPPPDPPECSGWRYNFISRFNPFAGGELVNFGDCSCCLCWVTDTEKSPNINENVVPTDGTFKNIEIGYVPFNHWTFGKGRYMIRVEQMSLTGQGYEFWKVVKDQKNGTGSLFQPAIGTAKGNIYGVNTDQAVQGIFYASSIATKILFLTPEDAPIKVPPPSIVPRDNCVLWNSCERLAAFNASRNPPPEWN